MFQYSADELRAIADVLEHLDAANGNEQHDLFFTGKIEVFWVDRKIGWLSVPEDFWYYVPTAEETKESE